MKKILALAVLMPLLFSCSSDDEEKTFEEKIYEAVQKGFTNFPYIGDDHVSSLVTWEVLSCYDIREATEEEIKKDVQHVSSSTINVYVCMSKVKTHEGLIQIFKNYIQEEIDGSFIYGGGRTISSEKQ